MAITVVGTAEFGIGGAFGFQSLTPPVGIALDDLVIICVNKAGAGELTLRPAGFDPVIAFATGTGNDHRNDVWMRWATANEPAAYWTSFDTYCGGMLVLRGVDKNVVFDVANQSQNQPNTGTPTCLGVTTVTNGCMIVQFSGQNANGAGTGAPTTDQAGATNFLSQFDLGATGWTSAGRADYELQATLGAYAAAIHTYPGAGSNGDGSTITVAFRPSSGSEGIPELRITQAQVGIILAKGQANYGELRVGQAVVESLQAESAGYGEIRVGQVVVETLEQLDGRRILMYSESGATDPGWETWLTNEGFDVTKRNDSALATDADIADFDLMFLWRTGTGIGTSARAKADTADIPLLISGISNNYSVDAEGQANASSSALLTGTYEYVDETPGITQVNILDATHPITDSFVTGLLTIGTADLSFSVDDGAAIVGDMLAEAPSSHANYVAGQAYLLAIEAGTDDLAGSPVATVRRTVVFGMYDPDLLNTDGRTLMLESLYWVMGERPSKPTILSSTTTTTPTVTKSVYAHPDSIPQEFTRLQIDLDAGDFSAPVYDSGSIAPTTTFVVPSGVLFAATNYDLRVQDQDQQDQLSRWSDIFNLLTDDPPKVGGVLVEFLTSADAVIESYEIVDASETYVALLLENLTIPATTDSIRVTPIKRGTASKGASIKNVAVDRGGISSGFTPTPYMPERDDFFDHGSSTTSEAIDFARGRVQTVLVDKASTFTFTNMPVGIKVGLFLVQDSTGSRTIALPAAVIGEPTFSTAVDAVDYIEMVKVDGSTIYVVTSRLAIA